MVVQREASVQTQLSSPCGSFSCRFLPLHARGTEARQGKGARLARRALCAAATRPVRCVAPRHFLSCPNLAGRSHCEPGAALPALPTLTRGTRALAPRPYLARVRCARVCANACPTRALRPRLPEHSVHPAKEKPGAGKAWKSHWGQRRRSGRVGGQTVTAPRAQLNGGCGAFASLV